VSFLGESYDFFLYEISDAVVGKKGIELVEEYLIKEK